MMSQSQQEEIRDTIDWALRNNLDMYDTDYAVDMLFDTLYDFFKEDL